MLGVSDVEHSLKLYRDVLGTTMWSWTKRPFIQRLSPLSGGQTAALSSSVPKPTQGAFSELLGGGEIELVQAMDRAPRNLFEGRYWGDLGFIHLCWDIRDMKALGQSSKRLDFPSQWTARRHLTWGGERPIHVRRRPRWHVD